MTTQHKLQTAKNQTNRHDFLIDYSIYLKHCMSIQEQIKKYLPETYRKTIGKASVTGYCIKFKTLKDINMDILEAAILDGVEQIK